MEHIYLHAPSIRYALEEFLQAEMDKQSTTITWANDLFDRLVPFASTGKLLRGSLVCFSYEIFSGQPIDNGVMRVAMAIELAHSGLLIHDDIMDGDELRRGRPSLHRQYQIIGETTGQPDTQRFGSNMALAGGDTALLLAFKLLSGASSDALIQQNLQHCFTDQMIETCFGQMQDVASQTDAAQLSKRAIYSTMRAKTGGYTIALPLVMGALLANQSATFQKQLRTFGLAAGTIFQIRDDELGAIGDTKKTGKPVGADIREGKYTLIYYYLLRSCSQAEQRELKRIFGNPIATGKNIIHVQQLIKKYHISKFISDDVAVLRRQAEAAIEKLKLSTKAKGELYELARFCSQRLA